MFNVTSDKKNQFSEKFFEYPQLIIQNDTIVEFNNLFSRLTGYTFMDIFLANSGRFLGTIFRDFYFDIKNFKNTQIDTYIFTKSNSALHVELQISVHNDIITLTFIEKPEFKIKFSTWEPMLEANQQGIAIISAPDFTVLRANKNFEAYYNKENVFGLRLSTIIDNWDGSFAEGLWKSFLNAREPIHLKFSENETPDSEGRYWSNSIFPIVENNNVKYLISILSDVTNHVTAEKIKDRNLVLEAEKKEKSSLMKAMEMKDEFLAIISHEFKTPLTVINSALQIMDVYKNKGEFEKAFKFTDNIKRNVFRQLRLINNLLDITKANAKCIKINKSNYDIVFLTRSISQVVMEYAKQKEVNLIFNTTVESRFLGIDEEKYERILLNLLSNAIKFTPKGKNIFVNVFEEEKKFYIQVKDEGIGIPKNKQIIIFKRFGQVDSSLSRCAEGTGIGLSLVKLLIKQLGGSISLKSEEGKGSCFTLCLPITTVHKSSNNIESEEMNNTTNTKLVQNLKIEFSDIYLPR